MNLTKLEFKKIFTPLTVIAVVVMLLFLNLYMTFDYRAAYLLAALDPDSKSKPIETLKSEYAEKRGEITDEWIAARRSDVENILNDPKYLKTEDELKAISERSCRAGISCRGDRAAKKSTIHDTEQQRHNVL